MKQKIPSKYKPKIKIIDMFEISQILNKKCEGNLNMVCFSDYGPEDSCLSFQKAVDYMVGKKKEKRDPKINKVAYNIKQFCFVTT